MKQAKTMTMMEKRSVFIDGNDYADRYVGGTYDFLSDIYDMKVAKKFSLEKVFDKFNSLSLRQDLILRYYYGIDRIKQTVEQIAEKLEISVAQVKFSITTGRKKFFELCSDV